MQHKQTKIHNIEQQKTTKQKSIQTTQQYKTTQIIITKNRNK